jgi:hypothetical protein
MNEILTTNQAGSNMRGFGDYILRNMQTFPNGAGSSTGTLTNAPTGGNPTKWIKIDDNGVDRFIPTW